MQNSIFLGWREAFVYFFGTFTTHVYLHWMLNVILNNNNNNNKIQIGIASHNGGKIIEFFEYGLSIICTYSLLQFLV